MNRLPSLMKGSSQTLRHFRKCLSPHCRVNAIQPARSFGSRWLVPRNFWIDHTLDDFRRMSNRMQRMERLMDSMMYERPFEWTSMIPRVTESSVIKVQPEKDRYKVVVDVSAFSGAENVEIKTVGDRLIIKGKNKHDAEGHTYDTQLKAEIQLPQNIDHEAFEACMIDDNQMVISSKYIPQETPPERIINIQRQKLKDADDKEPKENKESEIKKDT